MNVYDIVTDRIVKALEAGTVPWHRPWVGGEPTNLVSKKPYRGVNILLLGWQKYASPYWVTFNQARKLKGYVKAGEKGTPVVFWKVSSREITRDDGTVVKKSFILRYYTVFNTDQCVGLEVPALANREVLPIAAAEEIVSGYKGAPEVSMGGGRACYSPTTDRIEMPLHGKFESDEAYYATLFHELSHSTGHKSRLNRETLEEMVTFGSENYSREELVAEMSAAFLCANAGIENITLDNSAAYIAGWLKKLKSDTKMVVIAAGQAQKSADHILGKSQAAPAAPVAKDDEGADEGGGDE